MGRTRALPDKCDRCAKPARSRIYCATHARAWNRKYDQDRCHWEGCNIVVASDDWWQERYVSGRQAGMLKKIDGRTMDTGQGRRSYCRQHEVEHLRATPAIEQMNLTRLGAGLESQGQCWVPNKGFPKLGYGSGFDPEGSNGKLQWPYHRAVWDLLMGGHAQRLELDHLTGCLAGATCASPIHLQPVTHAVNMSRRKYRNEAKSARSPYTPNRCGPRLNRQALESPKVQAFALEYGLPLPAIR